MYEEIALTSPKLTKTKPIKTNGKMWHCTLGSGTVEVRTWCDLWFYFQKIRKNRITAPINIYIYIYIYLIDI